MFIAYYSFFFLRICGRGILVIYPLENNIARVYYEIVGFKVYI